MKITLALILLQLSLFSFSQFEIGDTLMIIDAPIRHEMIDVDNDGDLDFLAVGYSEIVWYENEGGDEFGAANLILTAGGLLYNSIMVIEDVNADGFMDFISAYNDGSNKIGWFENNGDGTFSDHEILTGTDFEQFQFYDDDADGDFDLIYIHNAAGVYRKAGNPDLTFDAAIAVDLSLGWEFFTFRRVYHSDFDVDGDEDLIYACAHEEGGDIETALMFSENLGGGIYASSIILYAYDDAGYPMTGNFADMDGDGDQDAILGHGYESSQLRYYENTGAAYVRSDDVIGYSHAAIGIEDIDLDGNLDVVGGFAKTRHQWFAGNGDGTFDASVVMDVDFWEDTGWLDAFGNVHIYDIDGDGDFEVYGSVTHDHFYFVVYHNIIYDSFTASGQFFADLNENGIQDIDEVGVDFPMITSDPEEALYYIFDSGNYVLNYPVTGTYTISPDLPFGWGISTPDLEYTFDLDGVDPIEGLDFGIYPTEIIDSIAVNLVGSYPRCNDTIPYWISIANLGTTHPGGIVSLTLDDSISFVSSAIPTDSIVEQTIYWSYDSIAWYDDHLIALNVAMPDYLSEGDAVTSFLSVSIMEDDVVLFLAEDSLTQIITCGYDPNDKIGFPSGEGELGFIGVDEEFIEYTVRFQNTGSDTAFTVRITDELDENFNWETIEVAAKSHDMTWSIDETGTVEFLLEDIALPDSNVNVLASQGFVKYKVWMNEGLVHETTLENTAEIYFDLNPPILTNTTLHTLFDCATVLESVSLSENVCAEDFIVGSIDAALTPPSLGYSWQTEGEVIEGEDYEYIADEGGIYEILVTVSTDFCEASEIFSVNVLDPIAPTVLPELMVCYGDSIEIFGTYQSVGGFYNDTLSTIEFGCDSIVTQELIIDSTVLEIAAIESEIICPESSAIELIGMPSGGVFSGVGVESGLFNPALAGIGDFMIYYSYTNEAGCESIDSMLIVVSSCLGVGELDQVYITAHPNPFTDQVTINFQQNSDEITGAVLRDLSGRQVAIYPVLEGSSSLVIDRANLSDGEYILSLVGKSQEVRAAIRLFAQ
jgi:hypothetical protein